MIGAALLRRLATLQLPTEAFQEVLSIIAEIQGSDEIRREKSRQRTSRWRHRDGSQERHGDGTVTSHGKLHPPPSYTTPPSSNSKKNLKNISMPDDFSPDAEFAKARGWTTEYVSSEFQRFRDHALAKGRKCRDWQAAWRNWVTSPYQPLDINKPGTKNGAGNPTMAAFDRLRAEANMGPGSGEGPLLDLTPASRGSG